VRSCNRDPGAANRRVRADHCGRFFVTILMVLIYLVLPDRADDQ
jgi:hypothetical protein